MSRKESFVAFPELIRVLNHAFDNYLRLEDKTVMRRWTNKQLADALKVPTTYVSYFRCGLKAPNEVQQLAIVDAFFPNEATRYRVNGEEETRATFKARLQEACQMQKESPSGIFLEDLASKRLTLRFATFNYTPLAGTSQSFFEKVSQRFCTFAGIPYTEPTERRGLQDYSNYDVLLNLFDTIDRTLRLKFFRTPARIGLGAVCDKRHSSKSAELQAFLTGQRTSIGITPIVIRGDVGWLHCRHRLGITDPHGLTDLVAPKELASRLIADTNSGKQDIPVVLVDEITALRVLKYMGDQGFYIFPLTSRTVVEEIESFQELPAFYSSFGVQRRNIDFSVFMQDALAQFLSSDVETLARYWLEAARSLTDEIMAVAPLLRNTLESDSAIYNQGISKSTIEAGKDWGAALEWVRYVLHLGVDEIETFLDPLQTQWRAILKRARQLFQSELASRLDEILTTQVAYSVAAIKAFGDDRVDVERQRLRRVFDLDADVHLPLRFRGVTDDTDSLIRDIAISIQSKLRDAPRLDSLCVEDLDGRHLQDYTFNAQRSILRKLQSMYEHFGQDGSVAVDRIERELKLMELKRSVPGILIIAFSPDDKTVLLGSATIVGIDDLSSECEIKFFWVDRPYRDHGIANKIFRRALEVAAREGCERIAAEVLPGSRDVLKILIDHDFRFAPDREPSSPGRYVLVRRVEPSDPGLAGN
jgi:RimJ/RimL family protein N-acetyltransferase